MAFWQKLARWAGAEAMIPGPDEAWSLWKVGSLESVPPWVWEARKGGRIMEDRMRILKMLEEKKISAEEAARLLQALEERETPSEPQIVPGRKPRWLKLFVKSSDGDQVRITLPWALVKLGLRFMPKEARSALKEQDIDLQDLVRQVEELGMRGEILAVDSSEGDHVKIWIE